MILTAERKNFSEAKDKNTKNKGAGKATIELMGLIKKYIKEQLRLLIYDNLIKPAERLQKRLVLSIISAFLIGLSAIFTGIGLCLLLFLYIPAWITFLIVGGILFIIGIIIQAAKNEKT